MSIWGKRVDDFVNGLKPDGRRGESATRQVGTIALGILIAAMAIFGFWKSFQPDDVDCIVQRHEVASGDRLRVASGCR